ncbi:hypothetical protein FS842_001327 [Serendipita sp. 407]|nr:hypothetical protein FS842_001327 [Serendipita sp. 407]
MPRYAIIDDTDPLITYTGNWQVIQKPTGLYSPEYNGTVHATNDPNATMSLNFWGTVINAYGTLDSPSGKRVPSSTWQLDSSDAVNFNQSGTTRLDDPSIVSSHVSVFRSGKIPDGQHHLSMKVNNMPLDVHGEKPMFYFDFFAVLAGDPIYVENVILDDTDTQWSYDSGWTTNKATGTYRESQHGSPPGGGVTSLGFHGTEITVYGTLNGTYNPNATLAYFSIDEGVPHAVFLPNITNSSPSTPNTNFSSSPTSVEFDPPLFHQKIWSTTGLKNIGDFQHTLTISIPGPSGTSTQTGSESATITPTPTQTDPGVASDPWYLDYVVYGPSSAVGEPTPVLFTTSSPSATVIVVNQGATEAKRAGAIAGGVVGGLFFFALIVFAFVWRTRRHKQIKEEEREPKEYPYPHYEPQSAPPNGAGANGAGGFVARIPSILPRRRKDGKGRYNPEDAPVNREEDSSAVGGGGRGHSRRAVRDGEEGEEEEVMDISPGNVTGSSTLAILIPGGRGGSSGHLGGGRGGGGGTDSSTVVTETNTMGPYSPGTAGSVYDYVRPAPTRTGSSGRRARMRETDGGVRLASGDEDDDPVADTLPPSYARY